MEREPSDMMFLLFIREYRTIGLPARIRGTVFNITRGIVYLYDWNLRSTIRHSI